MRKEKRNKSSVSYKTRDIRIFFSTSYLIGDMSEGRIVTIKLP